MGCAPSKRNSDEKSLQGSRDSRDFEAERIAAMVLMPNPTVEVTIGSGIAREPDFMHTVIFVFGMFSFGATTFLFLNFTFTNLDPN